MAKKNTDQPVVKQETPSDGKTENEKHSKTAENASAKSGKGQKKPKKQRLKKPQRKVDMLSTKQLLKLPVLLQEVNNRCQNMINFRKHVGRKLARFTKEKDPSGLEQYEKDLLNSKALEHDEQEFLRELKEEFDQLNQQSPKDNDQVAFYQQLMVRFEKHLRKHRVPTTHHAQATESAGLSTRASIPQKNVQPSATITQGELSPWRPITRAARRRMAASHAEPTIDGTATDTIKNSQSPALQPSQRQSPAANEEVEPEPYFKSKSESGERELIRDLFEHLDKIGLSRELRPSGVVGNVDSASEHGELWVSEQFFKLLNLRNELDRDLVQEVAKQPETDELWKPVKKLVKKHKKLKKCEEMFLDDVEQELGKAALRLADEPNVQTIRNEFRLRRMLETFRAHLGPYIQPGPVETTSMQEKDPYEVVPSPAQPVQQTTRKRKAAEGDNSAKKKLKLNGTGSRVKEVDASELEERREQLLQIVKPFLDDSDIVYDVSPPTGRAAKRRRKRVTEEDENNPRLMSGALYSKAVPKTDSPVASPKSSKKQRGRARTNGIPQDENITRQPEDEPAASLMALGTPGSLRRSKRLAGSHEKKTNGTAGSHVEKTNGNSVKTRSSSRLRFARRAQASPPEPASEESPTQQTLKVRRLSTSTRAPSLPPPRWRAGSVGRDDEPTRINGPKQPKMEDIMFRSPEKVSDHQTRPFVGSSDDPFTDSVSLKKKHQKRGSRASSEWSGLSTTPIPRPMGLYNSNPAFKPKYNAMAISGAEQRDSLSARFERAGTEPRRTNGPQDTQQTRFDTPPMRSSPSSTRSSRSLLQRLPGNARDDRAALEVEKRRWRSMLDL
ncbi:hypothetical protein G7054_g4460 [Neopestalotiopsis clavispora]|nr:hypothetical protein G7054_g4460 [Neopestalotiopsis clavispora]